MEIETAYYQSPIGTLEIKGDESFIYAIMFLEDEITNTSTNFSSPEITKCIKELQEYFDGKRKSFSIKIQQGGTGFQQSVWNSLLKIPYGNTISYMDLSKQIGNVQAIRAVGSTNGKNKIAIAIPCHRVIGSNGTLVGYAGKIWRKKWLLDHEAKFGNGVQKLF